VDRYRLRVELEDRPGALAAVATVLAGEGADVVSVDIHEVDGGTAVDEIVVILPADVVPSRLAAAIAEAGVATLLSSQRINAPADAVLAALQACAALADAPAGLRDAELRRALLQACSLSTVWIADPARARDWEAGRRCLDDGATVVVRCDDLVAPVDGAPRSGWVMAIADAPISPSLIAFVARPSSIRFSGSEVARAEALLSLRHSIAAPARHDAMRAAS